MKREIRKISCLKDVSEVIRIHNRTWNNSTGIIDLLENSTDCLMLFDGELNKITGYFFYEVDEEGGFWELNDLAIDPDCRQKGGGRLLMEHMLQQWHYFKLNADANNTKLVDYYKSFGFKVEAILENYYAIDKDAVRMVLNK